MKQPAVFFDRDNTLIVSDGYLGDKDQVRLINGAADLIAAVRQLGYAVVVFSNQSGVARGMFTEEAVKAVNDRMAELLKGDNSQALIDRHEYCPFHPEALVEEYRQDSELRKPRPGMILKAAHEMQLDLTASWVIGDAARDIEAGAAAGCRTILYRDSSLPASPAAAESSVVRPDFQVAALEEAREIISSADCVSLGDSLTEEPHPGFRRGLRQPSAGQTMPVSVSQDSRMAQELGRIRSTLSSILEEQRKTQKPPGGEFSIGKLLGGIVQVLALACIFIAFFGRSDATLMSAMLLWAAVLELLTIALLLMGNDR